MNAFNRLILSVTLVFLTLSFPTHTFALTAAQGQALSVCINDNPCPQDGKMYLVTLPKSGARVCTQTMNTAYVPSKSRYKCAIPGHTQCNFNLGPFFFNSGSSIDPHKCTSKCSSGLYSMVNGVRTCVPSNFQNKYTILDKSCGGNTYNNNNDKIMLAALTSEIKYVNGETGEGCKDACPKGYSITVYNAGIYNCFKTVKDAYSFCGGGNLMGVYMNGSKCASRCSSSDYEVPINFNASGDPEYSSSGKSTFCSSTCPPPNIVMNAIDAKYINSQGQCTEKCTNSFIYSGGKTPVCMKGKLDGTYCLKFEATNTSNNHAVIKNSEANSFFPNVTYQGIQSCSTEQSCPSDYYTFKSLTKKVDCYSKVPPQYLPSCASPKDLIKLSKTIVKGTLSNGDSCIYPHGEGDGYYQKSSDGSFEFNEYRCPTPTYKAFPNYGGSKSKYMCHPATDKCQSDYPYTGTISATNNQLACTNGKTNCPYVKYEDKHTCESKIPSGYALEDAFTSDMSPKMVYKIGGEQCPILDTEGYCLKTCDKYTLPTSYKSQSVKMCVECNKSQQYITISSFKGDTPMGKACQKGCSGLTVSNKYCLTPGALCTSEALCKADLSRKNYYSTTTGSNWIKNCSSGKYTLKKIGNASYRSCVSSCPKQTPFTKNVQGTTDKECTQYARGDYVDPSDLHIVDYKPNFYAVINGVRYVALIDERKREARVELNNTQHVYPYMSTSAKPTEVFKACSDPRQAQGAPLLICP